jgi:hypothetical protein
MHKSIFDGGWVKTEFLCAQPRETLAIEEGFEGVKVCDEDVDSHIEFIAVDQHRVRYVLLHHYILCVVQFVQIADHFDASSSGFADWLHDPIVSVRV